jgi:hypothetical protein
MLARAARLRGKNMPFHRFVATSALSLALAHIAACGQLSGDTGSPSTLTTIHGTVVSDSTSTPPKALATAIIWYEKLADGTLHEAADSVPVSGTFPASFSIALKSVPPASATADLSNVFATSAGLAATGVNVAWGFVVAYDDRNGNGQLDLVDASASQYVDEIEGVADRVIFYLDKPVPSSLVTSPQFALVGIDGSMPNVGYNLVLPESNYCFADADAGVAGACARGLKWEDMATSITLSLGMGNVIAPRDLQQLMCSAGPNDDGPFGPSTVSTISVADFAGALPAANDPDVYCDDLDNFEYASSCTTSAAGPCQPENTVCAEKTIVTLDPAGGSPIAPPAGWPCTAQMAPAASYLSWLAAHGGTSSGGGGGVSGGSGSAGPGTSSN